MLVNEKNYALFLGEIDPRHEHDLPQQKWLRKLITRLAVDLTTHLLGIVTTVVQT